MDICSDAKYTKIYVHKILFFLIESMSDCFASSFLFKDVNDFDKWIYFCFCFLSQNKCYTCQDDALLRGQTNDY